VSIPSTYVSPGDTFWCRARICNPGAPLQNVPFFALLDIQVGEYWFYPTWKHYPPDIDYELIPELPQGETERIVIPEFYWPDTGNATYSPILLYGALLNSDITAIIGEFDVAQFAYGPKQ